MQSAGHPHVHQLVPPNLRAGNSTIAAAISTACFGETGAVIGALVARKLKFIGNFRQDTIKLF
jgi:hypothetical protein